MAVNKAGEGNQGNTMPANQNAVLIELGKVKGLMEATREDVASIKVEQSAIHGRLTELQTEGCAQGMNNRRRIEVLETSPRRLSVGAAGIGGGIVAVLAGVVEAVRHWVISP